MRPPSVTGGSTRDDQADFSDSVPVPLLRVADALAAAVQETEDLSGCHLGPYRLMRRIGEGGFGAVYEAEQPDEAPRRVAIKIALQKDARSQVQERLLDEYKTLAGLQHPGIVAILGHGLTPPDFPGGEGRPYLIMELVVGEPITAYVERHEENVQGRIELMASAASAVIVAHRNTVIHRDLKPAHILVDESRRVKVIDFGVAWADHNDRHAVTVTGQRIGTPRYMSPEQRDGRMCDTRSDVYSLGLILAELFLDQSAARIEPAELTRTPLSGLLPASRRAWRRACRRDVDWIVGKCMAPDPEDRYQTVDSLHADLMRAIRGEPVSARSRSVWLPLMMKVQRYPRAATALAAVFTTVLLAFPGVLMLSLRNADLAHTASAAAEKAEIEAAAARLATAQAAIQLGAFTAASQHLQLVPDRLRTWPWHHLWMQTLPAGVELADVPPGATPKENVLQAMAIDPSERRIAVGSAAGKILLLDLLFGNPLAETRIPGQVFTLAFAPTSADTLLAAGGQDGCIRLFHGEELDQPFTTWSAGVPIVHLAFSPDGDILAATSHTDPVVRVYSVRMPEEHTQIRLGAQGAYAAEFDTSGSRLLIGTSDGGLETWEAASSRRESALQLGNDRIQCITRSPLGDHFAVTSLSGDLWLVELLGSGELVRLAGTSRSQTLISCRYSSSGESVFTCGADGAVRKWSVPDLALLGFWNQHDNHVYGLVTTRDGLVVTAGLDGTIRKLDPARAAAVVRYPLSPRGQQRWGPNLDCAVLRPDGGWDIQNGPTGTLIHSTSSFPSTLVESWILPDGRLLVANSSTRDIEIHGQSHDPVRIRAGDLPTRSGNPFALDAVTADTGSSLLLIGTERDNFVVNVPTGRISTPDQRLSGLDSDHVFISSESDVALVRLGGATFRCRSDGTLEELPALAAEIAVDARDCGRYLVLTETETADAVVYDRDKRAVHSIIPQDSRDTVAGCISPDGRCIALARVGGTIDLYDAQSSRLLLSLPNGENVHVLKFDEQGTLWAGTNSGVLLGWRSQPVTSEPAQPEKAIPSLIPTSVR